MAEAESLMQRLHATSVEGLAALEREDYAAVRRLARQRDGLVLRATPVLERARAEIAGAGDAARLTRRLEEALQQASAASDLLIGAVEERRRLVAAAIEKIPQLEASGYGWKTRRPLRVDVVR